MNAGRKRVSPERQHVKKSVCSVGSPITAARFFGCNTHRVRPMAAGAQPAPPLTRPHFGLERLRPESVTTRRSQWAMSLSRQRPTQSVTASSEQKIASATRVDEPYDLVIVGGGFSGIIGSVRIPQGLTRMRRCLILDNHRYSAVKPSKTQMARRWRRTHGPKAQR